MISNYGKRRRTPGLKVGGLQEVQVMLSNDHRLSGPFICEFLLETFLFISYNCSMVYWLMILWFIQVQLVGSYNGAGLSDWCAALISNDGK